MRIGIYTESALPLLGGQEVVVDALASRFAASGHEVVVIAPSPRHRSTASDNARPYTVVRHPRFLSTRRLIQWYGWYLANAHRAHRLDLVHCHSVYPAGYIAARCNALSKLPLVITSHCGDVCPSSRLLSKPGLRQRYDAALAKADACVAISEFVAARMQALCPRVRRIVRIGNGVDVSQFSTPVPRPAELGNKIEPGGYFLFLGRLEQRKGADLLLKAFSMVKSTRRMALVIAGDGNERADLQAQAAGLGIAAHVHFVGSVRGRVKRYLLQNSRCAVMPSRISEGFPLVLLESFAAGRPLIGTRIPGLTEWIEQGQTGVLISPESAEQLAASLEAMVTDEACCERLGQQAKSFARKFDWSRVVAQHLALYESLLEATVQRRVA